MMYPIIPGRLVAEATERVRREDPLDLADFTEMVGKGPEIDLTSLGPAAEKMEAALAVFLGSDRRADRDRFEGSQSPAMFTALEHLPLDVLDDPGFWAWLGLEHFWWLVSWRESTALEREPAKWLRYVDGRQMTECVVSRMFLRGQLCTAFGYPELAGALAYATDFWRSHVLRVSAGSTPTIAGAFVRRQERDRMPTDQLRAFARRLNRLSSNLVLEVYDEADADSLLAELADQ